MNRWTRIAVVVFSWGAIVSLPSVVVLAEEADTRPPNIVLILADDLGYGGIGVQGSGDIPTPHIDSLARSGVRCTQAYMSWPACNPSRAALMTGRYHERFGFEVNPADATVAPPDYGIPRDVPTMAEQLKKAGYATGIFGKYAIGFREDQQPLQRGFDEFFGFLEAGFDYLPAEIEKRSRRRRLLRGNQPVQETEYLTDALARESEAFIERHHDQPFFLYLTPNAVHGPLQADDARLKRFANISDPKRRIHVAMVVALDDAVGRILSALDAHDLRDNTLIVFTADNGGPTANTTSSNAPLRGVKGSLLEGGIRVPCLLQWPRRVPAGQVFDHPLISMDLTRTMLAAVDADLEKTAQDGINLLPWLEQPRKEYPSRAFFWRVHNRPDHLFRWACREGNWKLIVEPHQTTPRLYDLAADIHEDHDRAGENPERVAHLTQIWTEWNEKNPPYRPEDYRQR